MKTSVNPLGIWVLGYLGLSLCCGCGEDLPARAPVSGSVTWSGQPVAQGTITFYPAEGRSAIGKLRPDGTYELTTFEEGDGAVLGEHRVTIQATAVSGPAGPASFEEELRLRDAPQAGGAAAVEWLVPPQYAERSTSPLTAQVKAGSNVIHFDLPLAQQAAGSVHKKAISPGEGRGK